MRSRLRRPLLALLALLAIDLAVRATADVWDRHSPDDYAARVDGCRKQPRDLVFVGGSPVSEGIVPAVFSGMRWDGRPLGDVYAVGLPGGTTSEFYHALARGCPTPPRLVVYGITASDLNDARHEPHGPASLMSAGDVLAWAADRPDSRAWALRQYALARLSKAWAVYHRRHGLRMAAARLLPGVCPAAAKEADELVAYADALRTGDGYAPAAGFVTRSYEHSKANGIPTPPFNFLDRYRTGSHLRYLHRLIDWCDARWVPLVLVDMPVTADLEAQYPEAFAEYRRVLETVRRDRRLTVIRAHTSAVGLTDAGFADTIHLNGVGAAVLSNWLRPRLEAIGETGVREPVARAQAEGRP
jgi:hypothetical protein